MAARQRGRCKAKMAKQGRLGRQGVGSAAQVPRWLVKVLPLQGGEAVGGSAREKGTSWEHRRVPAVSMECVRHHGAADMALMAG